MDGHLLSVLVRGFPVKSHVLCIKTSSRHHAVVFPGFFDEQIFYPISILVNYNYEIDEKCVLGFSISYLVLEIFRFLTYVN